MAEEQNHYFTFGYGQEFPNGYVKIKGTAHSARAEMMERFGVKWSMQYFESDFLPQIEKYGLYEVENTSV